MTQKLAEPKPVGARGVMTTRRAGVIAAKRIGISYDEYMARRAAGYKWCHRCRVWLTPARFGVDRSRADGLSNICSRCIRIRSLAYNAARVGRGTPKRYWTGGGPAHSRYEDIFRLQQEGLTLPKNAEELGCSYWSVYRTVMRARDPEKYRRQRLAGFPNTPKFVSLDQPVGPWGATLGEFLLTTQDDHIHAERSERLREIVGDMEPEDVRLLDSDSLSRLQDRLREAGLVPRGIQYSERERIREPARHAGRAIAGAPLIPGKKKRRQKIEHKAANRASGNSNRPAQKPRKRWERVA